MTTTLVPIVCGCAAALIVLLLTPLTARLARAIGAVDQPADRRVHQAATPRLGGLAILAGFMITAALYVPGDAESRGLLAGDGLIALLGAVDDVLWLAPGVYALRPVACAPLSGCA